MVLLHLVRGLPGSGKTTYAKKWALENNARHYEADMWVPEGPNGEYLYKKEDSYFYHAVCLAKTFESLVTGKNVVVSNTFTQYWEMLPYIDIANRVKAKLSTYICRENFGTIHPVSEEILKAMKERWEE